MAKIQAVWAIDIGQAALKALKLVPGENPEQVVAEAFDFIEYPKILSQPDADPDELVREALATFTDRNDVKNCKVAIAVPGQSGLVKFIKLPPVEKKRIPDIVKFEAKQQIPFSLDEVVWAYQQIGGDEINEEEFTMAEVGLFAMKRDQINRAILPFTVAGIEVDIVQMSPIALYNFVSFDQIKGSGSKDSVVLLDIGADNTDLIITDGNRIWQRNLPLGGNHFTRALTKELKLTFAKAEHLKRNATKAPDPRAIFTAMRGVFNDFASEVNRSIGFYLSINRTAKIRKVVGLGNGFKLPGLQKFLQQNLNQEVERLEGFERMVGEEVKAAPQFQDNLASFAVAYGLGIQGLNRSGLSTNLLPPEIERVRLVRAKKPWALAASALIMLGLSFLFTLGDYRVLAKVTTAPFQDAVKRAKGVSQRGSSIQSAFDSAKSAWQAKFAEGEALIPNPTERGLWPQFLSTISHYFPDPEREYQLDPNDPQAQHTLEKLRVHIDAIKPVWRQDVAAEWFDQLDPKLKALMHPYDVKNPPSGEGWIIQIICHHYNPYPTDREQLALQPNDPRRTDFGPVQYLTEKVLPKLNSPGIRLFGVDHVAVAWLTTETDWTTEKGAQRNNVAGNTVPLLARASAPVSEGGGGGEGGAGMAGMMGMGQMMGQMAAMRGGMGGGGGGPMGGMGMMGMAGMRGMMGQMMGMGGPMLNDAEAKKKITTLTRTDFLLQFVWKPQTEEPPKTDEERQERLKQREEKVKEMLTKMQEEEKNNPAVKLSPQLERDLEAASRKKSEQIDSAVSKAIGAMGAGAGPAGAPGAAAPAAGAPAPGAAPPNPAAAPKQ
ncbi:MAG TPA: type IV pilus assembly protein PilM [Isosphaeraceae bacterium]|nr:type IV pilus assembly protein PilM [Isosphaeraceae bacterium]